MMKFTKATVTATCSEQEQVQNNENHTGPIKSFSKGKFTKVSDSGARRSFNTGSVRDMSKGKGRYDLIPVYAMNRIARHFENGAEKYADRNWEKGQNLSTYLDCAKRHLDKTLSGWEDEDHAAAAAWNILAYIETKKRIECGTLPKELDNLSEAQKNMPKDFD